MKENPMTGPSRSSFELVKMVADNMLRNQKARSTDVLNDDGLITCGVCGFPRRRIKYFADPTADDPGRTSPLVVTCPCKCDIEKEDEAARRKENERRMKAVERLKSASLMDEKFRDANFSVFETTKYNARNLKLCRRYVDVFDKMAENNQGLLLWGDVGTGKSFAAACIANALMEQKVPVLMTSFVKLLSAIDSGKYEIENDIINRMNKARLVIFDDLGAERSTDYALEKVYNIIDSRSRSNLPMILTTNLTVDEMKNEADMRYKRIYDRVFETCFPMQFSGPSWRKKSAAKRYREMEALFAED